MAFLCPEVVQVEKDESKLYSNREQNLIIIVIIIKREQIVVFACTNIHLEKKQSKNVVFLLLAARTSCCTKRVRSCIFYPRPVQSGYSFSAHQTIREQAFVTRIYQMLDIHGGIYHLWK